MSRRHVSVLLSAVTTVAILPFSVFAQAQPSPVVSHRLAYDSIEHHLASYLTYAQEAGHSVDRYYFRNDSLFFLYHRLEFPTGPDSPMGVEEERLYFSADTLVRWLGAHSANHAVSTAAAKRRGKEALTRAMAFRLAVAGCPDHAS